MIASDLLRATTFAGVVACAFVPLAHADIALDGTSTPTTYARGRVNSFLLDLHVVSDAFAGVDALTFELPPGVTLSAVRKRNTFTFCSDVHPLVDGMGTGTGGWYQLGWHLQRRQGWSWHLGQRERRQGWHHERWHRRQHRGLGW